MTAFAVFGNPIEHSKSPKIYLLFAKEVGISSAYSLKLASQDNFDLMLYNFFNSTGIGANITVPFKERAFLLCQNLTDRAMLAGSVNTIKKQSNNVLLGDNTDGIGFLNALKRLNWINENNTIINVATEYHKKSLRINVLLIGSGGAAKGIIPVLLNLYGCYINVVNRTFLNAQKLVQYYHSIGRQNISCIHLSRLFDEPIKQYDLIVNASSSSMHNTIPKIPPFLINHFTKCYDLFYQKKDTLFLQWCKDHGSNYCSDGLGMLVEQAAYSFYLWHNVFPSVDPVLSALKSTLQYD